MIDFSQMVTRLVVALILGAFMGWERERVGKEAGIRTASLVAGGAALFTIASLMLPSILATAGGDLSEILARNGGFLAIIANIVVGIGFLGAGLIIKNKEHVHGLTTAAFVWTAAAIGVLVGIGLIGFALVAAILISGMLFITRKLKLDEYIHNENPN